MKISYATLGCKLNQAETEELRLELEKLGTETVTFDSPTDIAIIRACAVTANASQSTRNLIRRAKKNGAYVVAVGCLENKSLPEIDLVAPSNQAVVQYINETNSAENNLSNKKIKFSEHTRANIKIQTGCNFQCTYCIIPSFRGKNQSVSPQDIINKIKQAEKADIKEIVLTGVNICQYNNKKTNLAGLLNKILKQTKIPRIRLGSMDPRLISPELIEVYKKNLLKKTKQGDTFNSRARLLPHWHLSLQSGSDTVLKRMNRNYTGQKYLSVIKKMRDVYPLFSFTTDIIVGFPGETEAEFAETKNLVQKAMFSKIHIFPYSPRPETPAAQLKSIKEEIKTKRCRQLKIIADKTAKEYRSQFVGKKRPILWEQKNQQGKIVGYSPEYLRVINKTKKNLTNKISNTVLDGKL